MADRQALGLSGGSWDEIDDPGDNLLVPTGVGLKIADVGADSLLRLNASHIAEGTTFSGDGNTFLNGLKVFTTPPGGSLVYADASVPGGNTITSTSETALTSTYTIPLNALTVGMQVVVELEGVYSGTVLPTIRGKIKWAGQTVIDTTAVTGLVSGTNLEWKGRAVFTIKTLGASGTVEANAMLQFSTAATAALMVNPASGSYTVDTTANAAITVTIQWGAGGTGQTITLRTMAVYAFPITGVSNVFSTPPTLSSMTFGSVPYIGTAGALSEDNANHFWDATNKFLGLGTATPAQRIHNQYGHLRFDHITPPVACSAALAGAGAGNVDNGAHSYRISISSAVGVSDIGDAVVVAVTDKTTNGQISLSSIPTGPANVAVDRKIYRTKANGSIFYLLTTISDNTTTTYTDNTADSSLGARFSLPNSAGRLYGSSAINQLIVTATNGLIGPVFDRGGFGRNVKSYGAVGGVLIKQNGAMTSGSPTLTSTGFVASDVGKTCSVAWAGTNQIANPTTAATVNVTGGGATGGLLAAGTYFCKYTWATRWGETTAGTSESSSFTIAAGNIPRVTIPALPANATAANIYLTAPGGASNTEVKYATGITGTTVDLPIPQQTDWDALPTANRTAGPLNSIIKTFNSATSVDLVDNATTTVASANAMWGWDDTDAFQSAIDQGAGEVNVPPGNYIISSLTLDTYNWIRGAGWNAQICQKGGTSGHLFTNKTASTLGCGIYNLTLHGKREFQTTANDGVHFTDATAAADEIYTIHNCFITSCSGNGIYLGNQVREVRILSCYVLYAYDIGFLIDSNCSDNSIIQLDVGHSGKQNVKILGGTNRLGGVKSFWAGDITSSIGYGYHLLGNANEFSGCEAQDNQSHAWLLDGCDYTAMSNSTCGRNRGDCFRLDASTDCKIYGQVFSSGGTPSTAIVNLVNSAIRNQTLITFVSDALPSGTNYVQGTVTGNDIHVGPDGGFQSPAFPGTRTFTVVAATDVFTANSAHNLNANEPLYLTTTGTLPAPLATSTVYYCRDLTSTTFKLSLTAGGAAIDITDTGTGTHTMQLPLQPNPYNGNFISLTQTAAFGVANPQQKHQGQKLTFEFTQDATGGREVTWGDGYTIPGWNPNTSANKTNFAEFVYDGTTWMQLGTPDIFTRLIYANDIVVPANYGLIIPESFEISAGTSVECAAGAILEVT